MNLLTKSLLEDLLENPVTVAIYGGGFKPPTKGHFNVAEKTLEEYPEIDELKIFVGGGVRDGITQEESIKVWDIYKNYLSPKVIVEPSVAPVKSVLGYAKENPTHKVYWVLGAREGDEDDLKDIESRTRSLEKYPNIEVKVITSSGGVSGTKTRQAIKSNNKEQFFHLIPDVAEKEKIWDILKPAVKESKSRAQILKERKAKIEEGFIDNMKTKFQTFLKALKQEGKETKEAVKLLIKAAKGEVELTNEQKEQIGNQLKDVLKTIGLVGIATLPGGFIAAALLKIFKQTHLITPSAFVNEVGEASAKVYPFSSDKDPSEIINLAKNFFSKGTSSKVFEQPLTYTFSTDKANYVVKFNVEVERQTYINFSKNPDWKPGPPYKTYASVGFNIEGEEEDKDTNLNEQFSVLSTVTKIIFDFIDKINEAEGNLVSLVIAPKSDTGKESSLDSKRGRFYIAYIKKNLSKYPEYKTRDGKSNSGGEYIEIYKTNNINEIVTDTEVICNNCGWEWPIADGGDDLYICHKCGHDNNPDLEEGTCGYDTDVKTGKKLDTPGGLEEGRPKKKDPKKGTGKKPEGSGRRLYTDEDPKDTVRIKFKTKEDIVDTLNKKQFKAKSHARQSQVINLIHQRVRAAYGKAKDPEVKSRLKRALDYIESRKESSKKKTERLRKMKEASDPQAGTALPYGSGFAPVKEKNDPFGLNELAKDFVEEVFTETWNPKDSFLSLAVFMKDNGMNVTPLPRIKVISDDKENASHLLGKTAYYNPADKSITLYTFGRHPKDVLRSFAHEMVHHEQNLNGTLGKVSTTNTNEDGHLEELEKEAYQKGNIMFRNWEDSIKNV
jgi:hypothetical protein